MECINSPYGVACGGLATRCVEGPEWLAVVCLNNVSRVLGAWLVAVWLPSVSVGRTVSLAVKVPVLRALPLQGRNIE